jgi:hypothetical protein
MVHSKSEISAFQPGSEIQSSCPRSIFTRANTAYRFEVSCRSILADHWIIYGGNLHSESVFPLAIALA